MIRDDLSVHDAATMLDLDQLRVYRLGRWFRVASADPCLPRSAILAAQGCDAATRYRVIVECMCARAQQHVRA